MSAAGAKAQIQSHPAIELVGPADLDRARVALVMADAVDENAAKVVRAIQRDGIPRVVLVASRFDEAGVVAAVAAGVTSFLRRSEATSVRLADVIRQADQAGCQLPEGLLRKAAASAAGWAGPRNGRPAGDLVTSPGTNGSGPAGPHSDGAGANGSAPSGSSPAGPFGNPGPAGVGGRNGGPIASPVGADGSIGPSPFGLGSGERAGGTMTSVRLSSREVEVLRLVADGYDTSDIAEHLAYSESTIKGVLAKLMARLDARNRCHAVAIVVREGLI